MNDKPLNTRDIKKKLPHRFPFLMIDRVLKYGDTEAVAIKNVSINEQYFEGHFPSEPIMPGVLLGECMAQTAAFIGGAEQDGEEPASLGGKAFLIGINLKIERPVVPGDQITIKVRLVKRLGKLMKIAALATVDNVIVASADLTIASV
jgi:3-hydroxyacyl-[acyl-carrier-protein] dehydratase